MQSSDECLLNYRKKLRQLLHEAGIRSNPDVSDDWILEQLSKVVIKRRVGTDCEKLSANAQVIFNKLKPLFPPDSWNKPQWLVEGIVVDNGQFDLRKSFDRESLQEKCRDTIGYLIFIDGQVWKKKVGMDDALEAFVLTPNSPNVLRRVRILDVLSDLDFQIETGDLVDQCESGR